ncbi:2'-5' RNA ligase family protein [Streptomyces griseoaurantiacus]|uniref:2'-5' RNA ligase family protein n=1 Tax=Streptomyces griseoaurantiacus TaxID=68213 RepID=UPI0038122A6E
MAPELAVDPRAFPCAPPADLDDPRVIVEHDWQAFRAVDRMKNHWDRPGWSEHQHTYYWMLTFADATALVRRTEHYQGALEPLNMDPVPADGLHVTMVRIGATELVTPPQLQRLVDLAQHLPVIEFRILAHPLAGSRGAVRFSLTPWSPLVGLHAALSTLGAQAGVPGGKPTSAFRPHLGVAYNNAERSAAPVIDMVSQMRSLPPVALDVTSVDLVKLRRQGRTYRWDTVRTVPLRPAGTASAVPGAVAGAQ